MVWVGLSGVAQGSFVYTTLFSPGSFVKRKLFSNPSKRLGYFTPIEPRQSNRDVWEQEKHEQAEQLGPVQ